MGIDYGIHAVARYLEGRRGGLGSTEAVHRMVCQTGSALGTTAVTTSAAFFALMLLDFRGFSELGFISGMGMLFTYVTTVFVLPAMVVGLEKLGVLDVVPAERNKLSYERKPFPFARTILLAAAVLTATSAYLFTRVDFQYDFTDLRYITEEREEFSELTQGIFSRSESPAIVLASSREEVDEIVEVVRERMRADTASPTVASVQSIFDLLPGEQERKLEKIREIREVVDDQPAGLLSDEDRRRLDRLRDFLAVDEPFSFEDVPENARREFATRDGEPGDFVFIYPSVPLRDGRNAIAFRDDIGTITTPSGKEFSSASSNLIVADMLTMISREGPIAVAIALGVVFFLVLAHFRRISGTVLVITPLLVGIVWMGGAMYLLGMKLNFFNVVVFPSIVGIGVDHGVHIYHRFQEEGPGSLFYILRHTGVAIAMTTVTTMVGYSGLVMAAHPGLQSIGHLAIVGLGTTFVTAVVVLPALLTVFGGGREAGAAEAVRGAQAEPVEARRETPSETSPVAAASGGGGGGGSGSS